ncbi:MAG: hypothetical protein GWP75_12115, partial [Planctomycetia bacterium]|nr:hypothetical protein [Planctomycetia bacterium]
MSNQKQPDRARLLRHLGLSGFVLLLLLSPLVFELIAQGHNAPLHAELEGLTQASLEQCELDDAVMADLARTLDPRIFDVDQSEPPRLWIDLGDGEAAFDEAVFQETIDRFHPDLPEAELDATRMRVKAHVAATNEKQRIREAFSSVRSRMRPV